MSIPVDDISPFVARRARVIAAMQEQGGGVAVLPTAPEVARNRDSDFPYRHDSDFYYLSAFPEPEAWVVLVAGDTPRSILFCRSKNVEREIWDGYRFGPGAAAERFGFDEAHPIEELDERLPKLLANQPAVYAPTAADPAVDAKLREWIGAARRNTRAGDVAPLRIHDLRALLGEMRLVKDDT